MIEFFNKEQPGFLTTKNSTHTTALLSTILISLLAQKLSATTFLQYRISRQIEFTQNSATNPTSERAQIVFNADEFRDPSDPTPTPIVLGTGTNQVVTPGTGTSPIQLNVTRESDSSIGEAQANLGAGTGVNDFETQYSTGSYRFELTGDAHSLNMISFPDTLPQIQNAASDWNNGALVFNPDQSYTIFFDPFASQVQERTFLTNRRDSAFLIITNQDRSTVLRSSNLGATTNSFVIPAGTFAPSENLSAELQFTRFFERISLDETSDNDIVVSNAAVESFLLTRFELMTVPEPSSSLLLALGGIVAVMRRSRK